tara:strand:- start:16835 stop:17632 length:798 start_codon:yes stop_codon:yes gene_type:complete
MLAEMSIEITVLGSGTSVGVPTIGCSCAVCLSSDFRDKRLRPSILIKFSSGTNDYQVVIDTTPDLRQQALNADIRTLDAILYTHSHADHIMGLDDVRPFNYGRKERIPVYGRPDTIAALKRVFPYAFEGEAKHPGGVPRLVANEIGSDPVDLFGLIFQPVSLQHGPHEIIGYRFGRAAYLTDHSDIPESSLPLLQELDVLFLDALRHEPHPMHTTVDRALSWVEELRPNKAFLTHICHDVSHAKTTAELPSHVRLAHDGLRIEVR